MQKNGPALVTMLWRILGNEQDVCDAYQQTFLNLAHLPGQRKPAKVGAYLYRTAANVATTMLRQKKLHRRAMESIAANKRKVCNIDYAHDLDAGLLKEKLRFAISQLPPYLGNVIVLHDLAELSYEQVAKTLNITISTARVYRSKAIALLAVWMGKSKIE